MFTSPYARDRLHQHPDPLNEEAERERQKVGFTALNDQCRLWSLLSINLLLYIHRDSPLLPLVLVQLERKVQLNQPHFHNRFETLAAILIGGGGEHELFDQQLVWYAGLMLHVTKLLSPYNWERVAQTLMQFVVAFGSEDEKRATDLPWEDHELRNDVVVSLCALRSTRAASAETAET